MIGANHRCRSILTTDDRESSEDDDESIIERYQPPTRSCDNFGSIVDGSFSRRKKRSVLGIRESKKSVRRSAALVVKNKANSSHIREEASRRKFACCDRCIGPKSISKRRKRRSKIGIRQSVESISHGALRQTSSSTSFLAYTNRRENNDSVRKTMRKFPPIAQVSSVTEEDEKNIGRRNCCHCSLSVEQKKAFENSKAEFFLRSKPALIHRSKIPCGVHRRSLNNHRVFTIESSSSEDRDVDYQVPIEYSRSCESGTTRTLVPNSSHITVRICPVDSKTGNTCGCRDDDDSPKSFNSQTSLNHFEDRVRRGLRAMRCCCSDNLKIGFSDPRNGLQEKKLRESESESRVFESLTRMQNWRRDGPESGEKTRRCCCCNKCKIRLSNSSEKPESIDNSIKWNKKYFKEAHGNLSTSEKEDEAFFQSRFRKRLVPKKRTNEEASRCGSASETISASPRDEKNAWKMMRNQRPPILMNKNQEYGKGFLQGKINDPTIVLSAPEYRDFLNRCERIRESIRSMMRVEGTKKCFDRTVGRDFSKAGSKPCSIVYDDLRPNLPPMNHWSQYGDRMRDVANEYKRLRLYLDKMNSKRENQVPSRGPSSFTSSRVEERIGKKEAIPAQMMQNNNQRCRGCWKHGNKKFLADVDERRKERSVWFEKIKEEKKRCCCTECDKDVNKIEESCATMRAREADLVRTLETFCEKIKRVKSEFDKPLATTGCFPCAKKSNETTSDVRCRSCCGKIKNGLKNRGKFKAKKLLIFPPEGEDGPPLTLFKNSSSVNCRVKGDPEIGFRYNVTYIQRFVSSSWHPSAKEEDKSSIDSG